MRLQGPGCLNWLSGGNWTFLTNCANGPWGLRFFNNNLNSEEHDQEDLDDEGEEGEEDSDEEAEEVAEVTPPPVSKVSQFGQQSAAAAGGGFKNFTKQKHQIGGRISESISEFSDPIGYQSSILKGGNNNKTKKSFIKNENVKSRRVHFSL